MQIAGKSGGERAGRDKAPEGFCLCLGESGASASSGAGGIVTATRTSNTCTANQVNYCKSLQWNITCSNQIPGKSEHQHEDSVYTEPQKLNGNMVWNDS